MLIKIPSEITKITTMSNGAIRLTVDSQENIHAEDKAKIMELHEKLGVFVFAEAGQMKEEDLLELPEVKSPEEKKSPATRLRNTIYIYWRDISDKKIEFETFYRQQIDKIIEKYKEKLI